MHVVLLIPRQGTSTCIYISLACLPFSLTSSVWAWVNITMTCYFPLYFFNYSTSFVCFFLWELIPSFLFVFVSFSSFVILYRYFNLPLLVSLALLWPLLESKPKITHLSPFFLCFITFFSSSLFMLSSTVILSHFLSLFPPTPCPSSPALWVFHKQRVCHYASKLVLRIEQPRLDC